MVSTAIEHDPKELEVMSSSKESLQNSNPEDQDATTLNSDIDKSDMYRMGKDQQFRVSVLFNAIAFSHLILKIENLSSKYHDNVYLPCAGLMGNSSLVS
jgi:hypothetical protein